MQRRGFLGAAAAATAMATTASAAAAADNLPTLNWRMASSFPKSLEWLYGSAELIAGRFLRDWRGQRIATYFSCTATIL